MARHKSPKVKKISPNLEKARRAQSAGISRDLTARAQASTGNDAKIAADCALANAPMSSDEQFRAVIERNRLVTQTPERPTAVPASPLIITSKL